MSLRKNTNLRKSFGQGMTEYIIIVALVAVAAIGTFKLFGQTAQHQVASLATELAGGDGATATGKAVASASASQTEADKSRDMGTFTGGNAAGRN